MTAARAESISTRASLRRHAGISDQRWWAGEHGLSVDAAPGGAVQPLRQVSVIVPAWNSESTIAACLAAIARAAVAVPEAVEAVVVDDGSTRDVYDVLQNAPVGINTRVVRVEHAGQSAATNAGARIAGGDMLVFLDSDMILNPWALDALRAVVSNEPDALAFGFREDVASSDPRLEPHFLLNGPGLDSDLLVDNDNRFVFDMPGFPQSLFAATRNLADLTLFRRIRPPGRTSWTLPRMAYGCILACRHDRFTELGGFDTAFVDWGFNDTEFASRWIARGWNIAPVLRANGLHIVHGPRHPMQWRRAGASAARYDRALWSGWSRSPLVGATVTAVRDIDGMGVGPSPSLVRTGPDASQRAAVVGDVERFAMAVGSTVENAVADAELGGAALRVLRLSGAESYLQVEAPARIRGPLGYLERGLLRLARGDVASARFDLDRSGRFDEWRMAATARYLLHRPSAAHWRTARYHLKEGLARAASGALLACRIAPGSSSYAARAEALLDELDDRERRFF